MTFHIQTALGKYNFTINGALARIVAPLQPSSTSCADLLPELWAIIFNELDHQAELIIAAGVCQDWRRGALWVLQQWIAREHGRESRRQYTRDEDFAYRGHLLNWHSCADPDVKLYHVHIWSEGIYLDDDEELCNVYIQLAPLRWGTAFLGPCPDHEGMVVRI